MEEEKQVHELPVAEERQLALARSLRFVDLVSFESELSRHRNEVHERSNALSPDDSGRESFRDWFGFFAGQEPDKTVISQ